MKKSFNNIYNKLNDEEKKAVDNIKNKLDNLGGDGDLSEKDMKSLDKDQNTQSLCKLLKKDPSLVTNIETVSANNIKKNYGSGEEVAKKIPGLTCKYGNKFPHSQTYGTPIPHKNDMTLLDKDGNVLI